MGRDGEPVSTSVFSQVQCAYDDIYSDLCLDTIPESENEPVPPGRIRLHLDIPCTSPCASIRCEGEGVEMSSSIHTEQLDLPPTSPSVGTVPTDSPPPLSPLSPLSPMSVCSGSALPHPQHSLPTQSQHSTIEDKIDEELHTHANLITNIDLLGVPE